MTHHADRRHGTGWAYDPVLDLALMTTMANNIALYPIQQRLGEVQAELPWQSMMRR